MTRAPGKNLCAPAITEVLQPPERPPVFLYDITGLRTGFSAHSRAGRSVGIGAHEGRDREENQKEEEECHGFVC